jgi:lysozyme family protein
LQHTFENSWNTCNICPKHLQNTWKTLVRHCNATSKWNTCNRRMKIPETLKHTLVICIYMQHPDVLLQHPDENTCNIRLI